MSTNVVMNFLGIAFIVMLFVTWLNTTDIKNELTEIKKQLNDLQQKNNT